MNILSIQPHPRQPDWWHVALEDGQTLTLDGATVVAEGLSAGATLSDGDLARLVERAAETRAFERALRFLGARPRSRAEVRRRLLRPDPRRAPAPAAIVERVLARLEGMGLLDDEAFAEYWIEQRERFSPRAAYALGQELRQRGVDRATADGASDATRDGERALAAARQRARTLPLRDYATFRARLGAFLLRRGFSYGIAREATRALWRELTGARPGAGPDDEGAVDET